MILRAVKDKGWSAINNTVLNDGRLSWRAKGIAAYLLSKPDDWRIDHTHLWKTGKEGRDAVLVAMKELEECGYLVRKRFQKESGKFATEVQLYEVPQIYSHASESDSQEPTPEKPKSVFSENQKSENQKSVFQDSLLILKPITERGVIDSSSSVGLEIWDAILEELKTAPPLAQKYLTGSRLDAAGISPHDKPLYRVVIKAEHAHGTGWLAKQVAHVVKRSLQRDLKMSIDLEFVAANPETEVNSQ